MILFSIVCDVVGGAEISTMTLTQHLQGHTVAGCNVLKVDGAHGELDAAYWSYAARLQGLDCGDICVSTHRNVVQAQRLAPNARHIVVIRGVPIENQKVRVVSPDGPRLFWQDWGDILRGIRPATRIVAPSHALANYLRCMLGRPVFEIQNVVDVPLACDINPSPRFFIWARNAGWKRRPFLVDAFQHANVKCDLIINGRDWTSSDDQLASAWRSDPWRDAARGDVVLSASLHEAFGRDVFEGAGRGCLVIVMENTPMSDLVHAAGCGRILPASATAADYAEAIRSLSAMDSAERARRGRDGSAAVRAACSPTAVIEKWKPLLA